MPRPRNPESYPSIYTELIEKVFSSDKSFKFECETKKEAETIRFTFYSFITACKRSHNPIDKELASQASAIVFSVKDKTLTLTKRDQTPSAISLTEALRQFDEEIALSKKDNPLYNMQETIEAPKDQNSVLASLGYLGVKK